MLSNIPFHSNKSKENWSGRIDHESDLSQFRFHQWVNNFADSEINFKKKIALIGFASDEGVRRNKGVQGAALGPSYFRKTLSNVAWPFSDSEYCNLIDLGDIECTEPDYPLEIAQESLGKAVYTALEADYKPFVIGGGHEVAFAHFSGLNQFLADKHPDKKLGIINIDAHFDLRQYDEEAHSGSPFLQMSDHLKAEGKEFNYFVMGINPMNNTQALFNTANDLGVQYLHNYELDDFDYIKHSLDKFIANVDYIYLTCCLDVFHSSEAPGVSAPAWNGIKLREQLPVFRYLFKHPKLLSFDIAELNPELDLAHQPTAKLAANLFYNYLICI